MCVRMCVCVPVRKYVHWCMNVRASVYVWARVCLYAGVCVCVCVFGVRVCMYVCAPLGAYVCACAYVYVCVSMHVYVYVYVCMSVRMYACVCMVCARAWM